MQNSAIGSFVRKAWRLLAWIGVVGIAITSLAACCNDCGTRLPTIVAHPQTTNVPDGNTATFTVSASSSESPLSYQWRRNGSSIPGATSASYTTPANTLADSGARYSVLVSNAGGSVPSNEATLIVTAVAPSIAQQPVPAGVVTGTSATFSVVAQGSAPLTYQWYRDAQAVDGATDSTYTLAAAQIQDNGVVFSVRVTNGAGAVESAPAQLTVTDSTVAPVIEIGPTSVSVNEGQTATFNVQATGTAPLTYQWRRNGTAIAGASATSYTTPALAIADGGGTYSVVVSNAAGQVISDEALVTVLPPVPSITQQPASVSVTAGQAAQFDVVATGQGPLGYQWSRNGGAISGATSASYRIDATALGDSGATFTVAVSNAGGRVTSAVASLTVNASAVAPAIASEPQAQSVVVGSAATFSVVATGTAPLAYQWQRNGANIAGATSTSYTTPATALGDSGQLFRVIVSNMAGSATSDEATLSVRADGPTITAQPQASAVLVGRPVTFSVAATASQTPLSYQWKRNGADVTGEIGPSYTLQRPTFADHGAVYSVLVRDARGTVLSDGAVLSVTPIGVESVMPTTAGLLSRNVDGSVWVIWSAPGVQNGAIRTLTPLLMRDSGGSVVTGYQDVDGGSHTALGLDAGGGVWAWGEGTSGRLGDGSGAIRTAFTPQRVTNADGSPLTGAISVQMGFSAGFAAMTDGTIRGWGSTNRNAGIGTAPATSFRASPVVDASGSPLAGVVRLTVEPLSSTAMAVRNDGSLWAWGGTGGSVFTISGDGSIAVSDHAIQVRDALGVPITAPRSASAGTKHAIVVLANGTVLGWGQHYYGELGDGSSGSTQGPYTARFVRTGAGDLFDNVAAAAAGSECSVFLRTDGSVWATGRNTYGCLGDGTSVNRSTPVQVIDTSDQPLTGVVEIRAGVNSIVAKKADGSFWVWGIISGSDASTPTRRKAQLITGFLP